MTTLTLWQFVAQFAGIVAPYAQLEAFETDVLETWARIAERQDVPALFDVKAAPSAWAYTFNEWRQVPR